MVSEPLISTDYWTDFQITQQDVEYLHNHLFELETPLTARELVPVLIDERLRAERLVTQQRREAGGKVYLPKESYHVDDDLIFPALNWKHGKVTAIRAGTNPEIGAFDVLTVDLGNGSERLFAANLTNHALNDQPTTVEDEGFDSDAILREYANALEKKIESAFQEDDEIVRIAGRWFPRALLVDVNVGHLNQNLQNSLSILLCRKTGVSMKWVLLEKFYGVCDVLSPRKCAKSLYTCSILPLNMTAPLSLPKC